MNNKPVFATVLILALLFSAVAGAQFFNLTGANPCIRGGSVPPDAYMKPPTISVTAAFEVGLSSGNPGLPISIQGRGFPAGANINLTYYSQLTSQQIITDSIYADSLGQFTYNTTSPDLRQALGPGLQQEAAFPIIFGAKENTTDEGYALEFIEYKRGLIQVGSQIAPNGHLFGNYTSFSPSAVSVEAGQSLRLVGKWFYPGKMTILWNDVTNIGTTLVNKTGFFDETLTVPATGFGSHRIVLRDANNVDFHITVNIVDGHVDVSPIQALINEANPGDTVYVPAGHYYGHVTVNKTVKLVGENSASTIIDGNFTGDVVTIAANNVKISGFTIQNSGKRIVTGELPRFPPVYDNICGVHVRSCIGSNISGNVVSNNFDGLVIEDCSDILVSKNLIMDNSGDCGIRIASSSSVTLSENNITRNDIAGLVVKNCSTSTVSENQIVANYNSGAVVSNSRLITVSNNNITRNTYHGLSLVGSHATSIFGNNIRSNTGGICISGGHGTNNNIYQNTIQANYHGIEFYGSSKNNIYHNNFINNSLQAYISHGYESNSWDDGYPSGGNYMSDYNGADTDGDGFGDTPYIIDENNQDRYPLMNPWSTPPSLAPHYLPYPLTVYSAPHGVIFTVDNVSHTAPWSEIYLENTLVSLTMPESHYFEGVIYYWNRWSDGNTNQTRIVTMNTDVTLWAIFKPENTSLSISVQILSPENKTYAATDVPLEFTIIGIGFFSITYSLDGQANVTIILNTNLTGLSEGTHNLIVYAKDAFGNTRSSDIVYFTVTTAFPSISALSPENKS